MARRPLESERIGLDGGRRTTQLMRDSLGGSVDTMKPAPSSSPRVNLSLDTVTSRHASLRTWRAQCRLGQHVTQLFLAVGNTNKSGAAVTGSFWAVRESTPIPLIASLMATFTNDPTGSKMFVEVADTMPFTGELVGRFLSLRDDAPVQTAHFAPAPPGDWWVADCRISRASFFLGIDDLNCRAVLVPKNLESVFILAGLFLGLWVTNGQPSGVDGAA